MPDDELVIRAMEPADRPAVLDLCRAALGWGQDDPNEAFFRWKHDDNPFGASPGWVAATPAGDLVGLRVFMRWRFCDHRGRVFEAVRAVDTATHPAWQGRGIFSRLTLGALPDLQAQGVQFVFNTPNDKSRPGYLKMGWSVVGRVPVAVRPSGPRSLPSMVGARTAAEMWSEPSSAGVSSDEALADGHLGELLERLPVPLAMATDRSVEFLRWRYGFAPLHYRAMLAGDSLLDGLVVFRVRRRGTAREATVVDELLPSGSNRRRLLGRVVREAGADYAIRTVPGGASGVLGAATTGFVAAPNLGPVLTWRPLGRPGLPNMGELALQLGDVELF